MDTQEKDVSFSEIFRFFSSNNLNETNYGYMLYFDSISLFRKDEFNPSSNFKKLCEKINKDKKTLSLKTNIKTIHQLNKLLKTSNLYDVLCKKSNIGFSKEVEYFVNRTNGYRKGRKFSKLSIEEQITIKLLNRLIIEEIYSQETPSIKNEIIIFIECETNPENKLLKCSPVVLEKIKTLKKNINNQNIIKQIEELGNPKRCVVIEGSGSKKDLVHGIVSYIYCTHTYGELSDDDWTGWNEDRLKTSVLYDPWEGKEIEIYKYLSGNTLFLKNLEGNNTNTFKQLAAVINSDATGRHGILIVSMSSAHELPEDFKKLCHVIELEPNKQNETIDTSQINSDFEHKSTPVFIYNKQGRSLTFNGHRMKLSEKRERLLKALKKPKNVRWILKIFYNETVERIDKTRTKRGAFDKFTCSFNKKWRETFALSGELIKCEDEIVSIAQIIKW